MRALTDRLKSWPFYVLPHHLVSRLVYWLTRRQGRFVAPAINGFVRLFNVDIHEAKHESANHYRSFNEFFTRQLKPAARPLNTTASAIVSPVDGCVSQLGEIKKDHLFQAKGRYYTVHDILGGRDSDAIDFENGQFATLYLSPRDYHRIHMPVSGKLRAMHYVPGRLFSVAPHTVRVIPRLFARNERVVTLFDTEAGKLAMILVGAINVAAIETVWAGLITPPNSNTIRYKDYPQDATNAKDLPDKADSISLAKGDEMGRFNMGSTVILLMQHGCQWSGNLAEGSTVRMGELIGNYE